MKYLLLIPSGVAVKTFLSTRFVDLLLQSGEVHIWHGLPEHILNSCREQWNSQLHWERLPEHREVIIERLWRQAKAHAHVHWGGGASKDVMLPRIRSTGSWANRCFGKLASGIGRLCANSSMISLLDDSHERAAARSAWNKPVQDSLNALRPDLVFCANQRPINSMPVMAAARHLKIPTATFIFSWDNLPKYRITVPSDYFLVWSESMEQELLGFYPRVDPDRVKVVGTPQLEHYTNRTLMCSREEFLSSLKLDPAKRVICFSGDDAMTSPHDALYLADLARAVREMPPAKRPQILFRPCPTDVSPRFDSVLQEFPEIVLSRPLWLTSKGSGWSQFIPTREDTALQINDVAHCDLVINVGSTMAMDFAVFDKPGIYLAYNPHGITSGWSFERIYRLPHFRSVHALQPVYWAKSAADLGDLVLRAMQCPEEKSAARQAWLRHHVRLPLENASERCARVIEQIAKQAKS